MAARRTRDNAKESLTYLRQSRAYLDALFSSVGEGAIVTDKRGNIARVNKAALDLLGCTEEELVGKWYPEAIVAEDKKGKPVPNIMLPITEAFLTGKPVFSRLIYRRKDGSKITAAQTVSPIILNNEPVGAVQIFRDITREVELENAKDEFIAIASHQLRTPATAVKQYLGILLQGYAGKLTKHQEEILNTAYSSNERQIAVITDLLLIAQIETKTVKLNKTTINLVSMIREIVKDQNDRLKKRGQKVIVRADAPVKILADKLYLRMALENLIDNASKYSYEKSRITVELSEDEDQSIVSVSDKGVGIAEGDLGKLFRRFSRIDNPLSIEVGGSGLGLFIVKKIIKIHGGKITVNSTVGRGSIFTVRLPKKGQNL